MNGAGKAKWLLFFGLDKWAWEGMGRTGKFHLFQMCRSPVTGHIWGQPKNIFKRNKYLYKTKLGGKMRPGVEKKVQVEISLTPVFLLSDPFRGPRIV